MRLRMLAILTLMTSMLIGFQPAIPVTTAATIARVAQGAELPFSDEFEAASLGANWSVETEDGGVVEFDTDNPQSGAQSVFIGQDVDGSASASLILAIDLSEQTDVSLDYWVRDNDNRANEQLRVSISDDNGASWTEIQNLDNTGQNFSHELIDLANLAGENGLTLNNQFRIRFRYSYIYFTGAANHGLLIDNVRLMQRAPAASFPLTDNFETTTFGQGFYLQNSDNGVVEFHTDKPQSGTQSVFLGQHVTGRASAALILAIDLTGQTDVSLDYWVRRNGENEELGLSISDDDGANWTEIQDLDNTSQNFSHQLIDLANVAGKNGLTLNNRFRIRFRYATNFGGSSNDGMVIDDLRLIQQAPAASFPLARESFETATFAQGFYPKSSYNGVVEFNTGNAQSGTQSVFIGQRVRGTALASLTLVVDLAGETDVLLDYWVRDNGAREYLRLSISDDNGANWTEIQNLDETGENFSHELINLADVAAQNGLTLTNQFRIRFSYSNNFPDGDSNDGMVIDDLRLTRRGQAVASFPLPDEGFEGTTFAQGFYPQNSRKGVVEFHTHNPHSGAQSVFIGQRVAGNYASASLIFAIDLAGQTDVSLDYWVRDNGADEDLRVSISNDDGANWSEIRNLDDTGESFTYDLIDLDEVAGENGLTLNNQFRIRFRYLASFRGQPNDGMVIDDLRLSVAAPSFTVYMPLLQR